MLVELTNRLSVMKEQFHARIDYLVNCGKMFLTPKALSKQEKKKCLATKHDCGYCTEWPKLWVINRRGKSFII